MPDSLLAWIPFLYLGVVALLCLHGLHRLQVLWTYFRTRHRVPRPGPALAERPLVTIQLPVFNEAPVVERLIDAACQLDWPLDRLQVQVLDDSTDETTVLARTRAAHWRHLGVDIEVLHRSDRTGFKAGALAAGASQAKGELLAIFDADFVPRPGFLRCLVPHFLGAPEVGMVQARWGHLNADATLLTRLSSVLLDGHFVLEHTYRNRSGCFFNFNGTAGMWRTACIADAGGWHHDTVTEDLDLSYRAQLRGWRFVYLQDHIVPAELPSSMRAFKTQQHRWAKGTLQTARKLLPSLLRAELPARVKLEAGVHLTANLAYPAVLLLAVLMPASVFLRGRSDLQRLFFVDLPVFFGATGSVLAFYGVSQVEGWGSLRGRMGRVVGALALGIGLSVSQTRAVWSGLTSADATFVRTPKTGAAGVRRYRSRLDWTPAVELGLSFSFSLAVVEALARGWYASLPFLLLFGAGFGYVGLASLVDGVGRRARASAKPPAAAPSPSYSAAS